MDGRPLPGLSQPALGAEGEGVGEILLGHAAGDRVDSDSSLRGTEEIDWAVATKHLLAKE